jgi:hypothetical protein
MVRRTEAPLTVIYDGRIVARLADEEDVCAVKSRHRKERKKEKI